MTRIRPVRARGSTSPGPAFKAAWLDQSSRAWLTMKPVVRECGPSRRLARSSGSHTAVSAMAIYRERNEGLYNSGFPSVGPDQARQRRFDCQVKAGA